jgi:hypothetical protein
MVLNVRAPKSRLVYKKSNFGLSPWNEVGNPAYI